MLTELETKRVNLMKRCGMTIASEYRAARRHLFNVREARRMLKMMAPDAYGRSNYSAEIVHQLACTMAARGRARLLRKVAS